MSDNFHFLVKALLSQVWLI